MRSKPVENRELFEDLATKWQMQEIARLNELLVEVAGLDRDERHEILEQFFFHLATSFDAVVVGGTVRQDGKGHHPRLTFESDKEEEKTLVLPSDRYELHDHTIPMVKQVVGTEDEPNEEEDKEDKEDWNRRN